MEKKEIKEHLESIEAALDKAMVIMDTICSYECLRHGALTKSDLMSIEHMHERSSILYEAANDYFDQVRSDIRYLNVALEVDTAKSKGKGATA